MIAARVFRASPRDALVLAAAVLHGAGVLVGLTIAAGGAPPVKAAVVVLLALAMCWGSNTVSHIHLHSPLFRGDAANRAFSLYLTLLLAVPQRLWKLRHLAHHGLGAEALGVAGWSELAALVATAAALAGWAPVLFATVYLPAALLGLGLCAVQGRQEHARSDAGVDHHGAVYNRLWFNDGFHAAHHRAPAAHWTTLATRSAAGDVRSALPPLLRWLEALPALLDRIAARLLDGLERATLGLPPVRWFLVTTHRRAWAALLSAVEVDAIRDVTIVGGGLFPRTALVLAQLLPGARLTIVDAVPAHLERARAFLAGVQVRFVPGVYTGAAAADLVVIPLAYRGDRARLYRQPPAHWLAVHDWLWRRRGRSALVSPLLLKRLNLVGPGAIARRACTCTRR
jgi:hypothetical protein